MVYVLCLAEIRIIFFRASVVHHNDVGIAVFPQVSQQVQQLSVRPQGRYDDADHVFFRCHPLYSCFPVFCFIILPSSRKSLPLPGFFHRPFSAVSAPFSGRAPRRRGHFHKKTGRTAPKKVCNMARNVIQYISYRVVACGGKAGRPTEQRRSPFRLSGPNAPPFRKVQHGGPVGWKSHAA